MAAAPGLRLTCALAVSMMLAGAVTSDAVRADPPLPTVTSVSPIGSVTDGLVQVTIHGSGLAAASDVEFGAVAAQIVPGGDDGSLTVVAPAHAAGPVDVTVTTDAGTSLTVAEDVFYYYDPALTITSLSPRALRTSGNSTVTVSGTGFSDATAVLLDGVSDAFNILSDTQIGIFPPSHAAGPVVLEIDAGGGVVAQATFYYEATPSVTNVSPASGGVSGGASVTIIGTGLLSATGVSFGGIASPSFSATSGTELHATVPPAAAGTVDVTVASPAGTSPTSLDDAFLYLDEVPAVTSVTPAFTSLTGGDSIGITGTAFSSATGVSLGGTAAASFVVDSPTHITAVTDVSAAVADGHVKVTNPQGSSPSSAQNRFLIERTPTVTGMTPPVGPTNGGQTVGITGTGFIGTLSVNLGVDQAVVQSVDSDTHLTVTMPSHATGAVHVTVTNGLQTSATSTADLFRFGAVPTTATLQPAGGPTTSGRSVVIVGTNFYGIDHVKFGSASAGFVVDSPAHITATAPAHGAGGVAVTVSNAAGTSPGITYVYQSTPAVFSATPRFGRAVGGGPVSIVGSGLLAVTGVAFGAVPATTFHSVSTNQLIVTPPPHGPGLVDIRITTASGTSAIVAADRYTYDATPAITAVSARAGSTLGGATVTVTGSGFLTVPPGGGVKFGATPSVAYTVVSDTKLQVAAPAHVAGRVDVRVSNTSGISPVAAADQYTYDGIPTITSVTPRAGRIAGGQLATLHGTGFLTMDRLYFDLTQVSHVTIVSDTELTATVPAHGAGPVILVLANATGLSAIPSTVHYTYDAVPTVTLVSPASGKAATSIALTGTGLLSVTSVKVGGVAAAFVVVSDTRITVTAPAHGKGTVDVRVTNPSGTSLSTTADRFTYT